MEHQPAIKRYVYAGLAFMGLTAVLAWLAVELAAGPVLLDADEADPRMLAFFAIGFLPLVPTFLALARLPLLNQTRNRLAWLIVALLLPSLLSLFGAGFIPNHAKGSLGPLLLLAFLPAVVVSLAVFSCGSRRVAL